MRQEFGGVGNGINNSNNNNNSNKFAIANNTISQQQQNNGGIITKSASTEEEPSSARVEGGERRQFDELERTMQSLGMSNGMTTATALMALECPTPTRQQQVAERQQSLEGSIPSSSASSSSTNSSMEAGLNAVGHGGQQQQTQKRKMKKCLHLDLLSISNVHSSPPTGCSSPAAAGQERGILSPWNQPQFQQRRAAANRPGKLFPVHILPYLYLGNDDTAKNRDTLNKCGIRYVVNVTSDLPNYFEAGEAASTEHGEPPVQYMRIPVDDNCSHNLAQFFPEAISFIEKARTERAGVLVHCWAGISRSVTVCLAYLMYSLRCPLEEAFDRLLKQNGTIAPNFHFMEALTCWERELFAASFSSSAMGIHLPAPHLHPAGGKSPNGVVVSPRSPSAFGQFSLEAQTAAVP